jgi:hypothetical protein
MVQLLASLQGVPSPTQWPLASQVVVGVQASPSSQLLPTLSGSSFPLTHCMQPL